MDTRDHQELTKTSVPTLYFFMLINRTLNQNTNAPFSCFQIRDVYIMKNTMLVVRPDGWGLDVRWGNKKEKEN